VDAHAVIAAYSTDRSCSTAGAEAAISSISSKETVASLRASARSAVGV